MSVLKLFFSVLLLPVVVAITVSFLENLRLMAGGISAYFGWGVVSYLIIHIILYEPVRVYDTGKKISEKALGFFSPLVKVAGFCIPIFSILSFVAYFIATLIWKETHFFRYFVFFASFALTMHLVFTVNSLKGKAAGFMKENYFFSVFLIYIINILIIAGAFSLLSKDFLFLDFFRRGSRVAAAIYTASFRQLFEVRAR